MAIVTAAVVPQPPALLPGVTGSPIAEVEQLRSAAAAAVHWVVEAGPDVVIALSAGERSSEWRGVPTAADGYLGARDAGPGAPLGLAVVATLLPTEARVPIGWHTVHGAAPGADAANLGAVLAGAAPRVGLVVAGDGSARRGLKAPGHLDERAAPFDARVQRAFATGDPAALLGLDAALAAQLLVAGRAPWQALAGAVGARPIEAQVDYADDPFGVSYVVVRWRVG